MFNNSICIAKKTQHFSMTKDNWLILFKETIAVYSENHMKHIKAGLLNVETGATWIYHWTSKGLM
jgi:hypothetical protein